MAAEVPTLLLCMNWPTAASTDRMWGCSNPRQTHWGDRQLAPWSPGAWATKPKCGYHVPARLGQTRVCTLWVSLTVSSLLSALTKVSDVYNPDVSRMQLGGVGQCLMKQNHPAKPFPSFPTLEVVRCRHGGCCRSGNFKVICGTGTAGRND